MLDDVRAARKRIANLAIRTPLVRFNVDDAPGEVYLKLENLQPIGSFKIRGAANAIARSDTAGLDEHGVYTASAGNMAQGVAYAARRHGLRCRVVVPDNAPRTKLDAVRRLGAEVIAVPYDAWWRVLIEHDYPGVNAEFIHPVSNRNVIAGNGTIGLEVLEDLPDVDTIIVPFGGGGLSCGIAAAVKSLRPSTKVFAAEVGTAAPLAASLAAGEPTAIDHTPSFVDGIGGKSLLPEMWPMVRDLIDESLVVSLTEIADAIRLLAERNNVIAEGAGAASVAAAMSGAAGSGKIVCVISGGNIDAAKLVPILDGRLP